MCLINFPAVFFAIFTKCFNVFKKVYLYAVHDSGSGYAPVFAPCSKQALTAAVMSAGVPVSQNIVVDVFPEKATVGFCQVSGFTEINTFSDTQYIGTTLVH